MQDIHLIAFLFRAISTACWSPGQGLPLSKASLAPHAVEEYLYAEIPSDCSSTYVYGRTVYIVYQSAPPVLSHLMNPYFYIVEA